MLVTLNKATSILGKFPWLSCGGHVLNLVASDGFDKVDAVCRLVTKSKQIVGYIKISTTASNALREQQRVMNEKEI